MRVLTAALGVGVTLAGCALVTTVASADMLATEPVAGTEGLQRVVSVVSAHDGTGRCSSPSSRAGSTCTPRALCYRRRSWTSRRSSGPRGSRRACWRSPSTRATRRIDGSTSTTRTSLATTCSLDTRRHPRTPTWHWPPVPAVLAFRIPASSTTTVAGWRSAPTATSTWVRATAVAHRKPRRTSGRCWGRSIAWTWMRPQPYAIPPDNPFVATPGARAEIWSYGLRNPWRLTFDPSRRRPLDLGRRVQGPRTKSICSQRERPGGRNYGWPLVEGTVCHVSRARRA